MEIIKYKDTHKIDAAPSTAIWEYHTEDETVSVAVAHINGRYPEKGFALNTKFKELVFVLSGSGKIIQPDITHDIEVSDEILIQPNEKYAWEGNMTLFMATTPKFDAKLHKILKK